MPVNPMKQLISAGATFIARTHATQVNHMIQMIERAMDHPGFSAIECLSECVEFYPGAFDPANPRKGGSFELIQERKWDNTPEDELRHDVTDELAAYKLAQLPFPGVFGVFFWESRQNGLSSDMLMPVEKFEMLARGQMARLRSRVIGLPRRSCCGMRVE